MPPIPRVHQGLWATALALLLPLTASGSGVDPQEAPERVHLQVLLTWGGGPERTWDGTLGFAKTRPPTQVPWTHLVDFEEGDLLLANPPLPRPEPGLPRGWRSPAPRDFGPDTRIPPGSARIRTRTTGSADGICFEIQGPASAPIRLVLGPRERLATTLGELRGAVRVVPCGDGAAIVARGIDLGSRAPLSRPHGEDRAVRASLHTHSCFSTGDAPLAETAESLVPFVRTVWWTDHNVGEERTLLAGDFEDPDLVDRFWLARGQGAAVVAREPTQRGAGRALRLGGHGFPANRAGPGGGMAWLELGEGAGWLNTSLAAEPELSWRWRPEGEALACVTAQLASGRSLRYLSRPAPTPRPGDVVLDSPAGTWTSHHRDLAADAENLFGDAGDGLRHLRFGVLCPAGESRAVAYDDLALGLPHPADVVRANAAAFGAFSDLRSHVGLEQTAWRTATDHGSFVPHFTALLPGDVDILEAGFDAPPTPADRAAFVARVHAAGGVVGTHHMHLDEHYEALLAYLLEDEGHRVDLFELGGAWMSAPGYGTDAERRDRDAHGYPRQEEDELHPLLVRWDRLTARGVLTTGYGAPDLHIRFDRPTHGWMNRWLSWILAPEDDPAAQLEALRAGRVVACESRSSAAVSLELHGRGWMGRVVTTDRPTQTVTARFSHVLPGSRLRWIQGDLVRATAETAGPLPEPTAARAVATVPVMDDGTVTLEVPTERGVFVRAELLDPAGQLVALSNPITFAPYWPTDTPAGRSALDWGGHLVAEPEDGSLAAHLAANDLTPPRAPLRALPPRKDLLLDVAVGIPGEEEVLELEGFRGNYEGLLSIHYRELQAPGGRFVLETPADTTTWLRLRLHEIAPAWASVRLDGTELGTLAPDAPLTWELPPAPGTPAADGTPGPTALRVISFELPERTPRGEPNLLRLKRVQLWAGDGVVDF